MLPESTGASQAGASGGDALPMRRRHNRWGLEMAFGTLAVLCAADLTFGSTLVLSGSYAIAAAIAATVVSVRGTAVVGGAAVAAAGVSGLWNHNFGTLEWSARLLISVVLAGVALLAATIRVRREVALRHMTVVAETAQRAVLRAMPSTVESVAFAARYVSATQEAMVGGDLYEVLSTPNGVRLIIGDVRGKGLGAVQLAATVISGFRQAAYRQSSLTSVAADLDDVVRGVAGPEDFVTVLLVEFRDDRAVTLVNCGHHPPLLITPDGDVRVPPAAEPAPPLGLGPMPTPVTSSWATGARMLFYTDGLTEARNAHGTFFPLQEHAPSLRTGTLEEALDRLIARLVTHTGRRVTDDMALVIAENHWD